MYQSTVAGQSAITSSHARAEDGGADPSSLTPPPANPPRCSPGTLGPPATARTCGSATLKDRPRAEFLQRVVQQKRGYGLRFAYVPPVWFALAHPLPAASRLRPGLVVHSFIPVKCKLMEYWKSRGFFGYGVWLGFFSFFSRRQVAACDTVLPHCWQELPFLPPQDCSSAGDTLRSLPSPHAAGAT